MQPTFSKARDTSKVPVDYTYIKKYQKATWISFLGFVIFNTHQTMIVEPKNQKTIENDKSEGIPSLLFLVYYFAHIIFYILI